ncbi:MAG: class I SAM-dependent methyltransferase [Candidatus Coatesbacteria bacterium]
MTHPLDDAAVREYLICPACREGAFETVPFERDGLGLVHGVLVCDRCRGWYRVEDRLPELLLPPLRDPDRTGAFAARFRSRWDGWSRAAGPPAPPSATDALKMDQIRFFRGQATVYDHRIADSPFWNAFDRIFLDMVERTCRTGGVLVEIGAGTGRFCSRLAGRCRVLLSVDLSEEMTRVAMAKAAGTAGSVLHLVADAGNLPVRMGVADGALFAGVLSYLAAPQHAIAEAVRILAPGGCVMGEENNRSAFRPWFDLLMSVRKSWVAKSYPARGVVSRDVLASWLTGVGVSPRVWTEVFLPPHLFNLLSAAGAGRLMRATNAVAGRVPWFRNQGGLVVFSGTRDRLP